MKAAADLPGRSRYPGTRPFSDSAGDRARFFGRETESEELYLRVLSVPLLVQFGKSGLGKTSLLQAGLFPRLRQKPLLPVMVRLNVVTETLTQAVARSLQQTCEAEGIEFSATPANSLWELLANTTLWRDDLLLTPVLVFDQFEEVFTLRDARFREDLALQVGAVTSGNAPPREGSAAAATPQPTGSRPSVKIVISLREDYLGALEEFSNEIPGLFHERLRLEPLSEEAARHCITEPAKLVEKPGEEPFWAQRFGFDDAALDALIAYLKGHSAVIEPFQLQLLCRHAEAIANGKPADPNGVVQLGQADFGGDKAFASVLKNFYRDTLKKLPGSQRGKAEELCEEELLDTAGHRLMLQEDQILKEFGIKPQTLASLSEDRLLRRERRLESVFYEISHDRLAESIKQSRRIRLPKSVRRVFWPVAGVVAMAAMFGLYQVYKLSEARDAALVAQDSAENQRARADAERRKAEDLLSFLLGEQFLGEVRDTGRSSLLMQLHDKVQGYTSADDVGTPLNRALALRNVGDIELTQGRLVDAREHYARALDLLKRLPETPPLLSELARTQGRLGGTLRDQGRLRAALAEYEAATAAWRRVAGTAGSSDDCTGLADSLIALGELTNRMGRAEPARQHMQEALGLASAVLLGRGAAAGGCGPSLLKAEPHLDSKALAVFSRALQLRTALLNYQEDYEGAEPLAQEALRLNPSSSSARIGAQVALSSRAGSKAFSEPQVALVDYRRVLAESEEMRRWDPSNRQWQREHAVSQMLLGSGIVACHAKRTACNPLPRLEEAEAISLEAIAALRGLAPLDKSNASITADLGWAWREHAKVLEKMGRHADRLLAIEQAEQSYASISPPDPDDADAVTALAATLQEKASALAALNRREDAAQEMQRAIALFTALDNAHPNHPTYALNLAEARAVDIASSKTGNRSATAKAAKAEADRLRDQSEVMPRDEQNNADQRDAERFRHMEQGQRLLDTNDLAGALAEFLSAEREARNYLRFKPALSQGYENLLAAYRAVDSAQEKLKLESGRRQPLVGAMYSAQMAALLNIDKQSVGRLGNELLRSRHALGVYLYGNDALLETLPMVQEEVALSARLAQQARMEYERRPSTYAAYAAALRAHSNAKYGLGILRQLSRIEGWQEAVRSALIDLDKAAKVDPKDRNILQEAKDMREFLKSPNPEGSSKQTQ